MSESNGQFETHAAWQKARALTRAVYEATAGDELAAEAGLKDQMRRAAVATMSNIAAGFERLHPADLDYRLPLGVAVDGNDRVWLSWTEGSSIAAKRVRVSRFDGSAWTDLGRADLDGVPARVPGRNARADRRDLLEPGSPKE